MTKRDEALRFIKYCVVGCINTLITLGVIFLCKSMLGVNPYVSNALGYVAGLINSYIWNKHWVFHSRGGYLRESIKFFAGFGICYGLQFLAVWAMSSSAFGSMEFHIWFVTLSGYGIATLIGNVLYTLLNFVYNRVVTFH